MASEQELVKLSVFLGACFLGKEIASLLRVSPIVTYVAIGALLGPPLADFVPIPSGIMLAGLLGIQLSVIDAGITTRREDLKKSAVRALFVAVLGVIFPIAGALLIVCVTEVIEGNFETGRTLKMAFASGAAISPTSLGVTARLLAEVGELESRLGQLISVAAVFDDVISLVLLSQVISVADPNPSVWVLIRPIVLSIVFIIGTLVFALILPELLRHLYRIFRVPDRLFSKVGIWLILGIASIMTYLATLASTSFLLAGYLTGVAFAEVPSEKASDPWKKFVAIYIEVLTLLFFAATIGFVIPLRDLFSASSLGIGALLSLVAVFGKMLCGLGMLPHAVDGLAVAVAMLGRGEFGFLIAAEAHRSGLLTDRIYAATTWGVLVPTLLTPLVFGPVFRWRKRRSGLANESESSQDVCRIEGIREHVSAHEDIREDISANGDTSKDVSANDVYVNEDAEVPRE